MVIFWSTGSPAGRVSCGKPRGSDSVEQATSLVPSLREEGKQKGQQPDRPEQRVWLGMEG